MVLRHAFWASAPLLLPGRRWLRRKPKAIVEGAIRYLVRELVAWDVSTAAADTLLVILIRLLLLRLLLLQSLMPQLQHWRI